MRSGQVPRILMLSPLLRTEMNHHDARQNPRANSNVGLVTLQYTGSERSRGRRITYIQ